MPECRHCLPIKSRISNGPSVTKQKVAPYEKSFMAAVDCACWNGLLLALCFLPFLDLLFFAFLLLLLLPVKSALMGGVYSPRMMLCFVSQSSKSDSTSVNVGASSIVC